VLGYARYVRVENDVSEPSLSVAGTPSPSWLRQHANTGAGADYPLYQSCARRCQMLAVVENQQRALIGKARA
jgi:hypothetical protein